MVIIIPQSVVYYFYKAKNNMAQLSVYILYLRYFLSTVCLIRIPMIDTDYDVI